MMWAVPSAYALKSDSKQPILVEADQAQLDQKNQSTTFSGNVIVKQGSVHIQAGSVNVVKNSQGQQFLKAQGKPVRFSQTLDDQKGVVQGQANQVSYSSVDHVLHLVGNAKVTRGGDRAEGASITYNTQTEVYTVNGNKTGKNGRRVNIVIQPNSH